MKCRMDIVGGAPQGRLRPDDDTLVDEDGNVYDKETGEEIGNIVDEAVA